MTRKDLLLHSKISNILNDTPLLKNYELPEGEFIPYKGCHYCWLRISPEGQIILPNQTAAFLSLEQGMELLSIRSSNIAFAMGAKGPILEMVSNYKGYIEVF